MSHYTRKIISLNVIVTDYPGKAAGGRGDKVLEGPDANEPKRTDAVKEGRTVSLTFQEIVELMKMIEAGSCQELVLESEGAKLIIRRGASAGDTSFEAPGPAAGTDHDPDEPAAPAARRPTGHDVAPVQTLRSDGKIEVRAPMVGTFYRAPSPDAPAFVELDSEIKSGDPLCVIEVMKLFTTIEASAAGRVVEIAPDNGKLVEYDALLFVIEPL